MTLIYLAPSNSMFDGGGLYPESNALVAVHERFLGHPTKKLRLLLSYYYARRIRIDHVYSQKGFRTPHPPSFLDSGAYSAFTKGKVIDLGDYCDYIDRHLPYIEHYANLDVISDPTATLENQRRMEVRGYRPIPVFHTGESWKYLDYYLDAGHDYIAIGGMVPYMKWAATALMPWLREVFARVGDRARLHGFGCTNWKVVKALPWYSVDSSSWLNAFRYGRLSLFDPTTGEMHMLFFNKRSNIAKLAPVVRSYGFDPEYFISTPERYTGGLLACLSFVEAAEWLRVYHANNSHSDTSRWSGLFSDLAKEAQADQEKVIAASQDAT